MRLLVFLACLVVGCVSSRVPPLTGDGALQRVHVPWGRGTNSSVATPGYVVFDSTGPRPILLCTDRRLQPVATTSAHKLVTSSHQADTVLCCDPRSFTLLDCPDFERREQLEVQDSIGMLGGTTWALRLLPYRSGWVYVGWRGHVARIEANPLRVEAHGKAGTDHVIAEAVDDATGRLILVDPDEKTAEVFDIERMERLAAVALDCKAVGGHARVSGGVAWVSTHNGSFLRLDLASATVTGRTVLVDDETAGVTLDLSPSGQYLAACASSFRKGGPSPTVLRVYRIEEGELTEVAAAQADLPHVLNGITILEEEKTVILNSQHPVLAWHYGGAEPK